VDKPPIENTLAVNNSKLGFFVDASAQAINWAIDHSNAYNNATNYSPADAHVTNSLSIDPQLGTCKVWIPDASPMKRAGKNGADIGANILYRYQDGVLTTQPLWDPVTGQFPCGAIVPGVNDLPGQSCFDVHQRLHVNTNGCPFPAGYGQSATRPTLTVSATTIAPGGTVTATWSGVSSPTVTDWVGVYSAGADDRTFTAWAYTSSCTTIAGAPAKASGACPLPLPTTLGTYELRLFAHDGYTKLATSPSITVTLASLRGDLNGDGQRNLSDVRLLIYMLLGQQAKTPAADLTGDGAVTLADVQALIRLIVGIP